MLNDLLRQEFKKSGLTNTDVANRCGYTQSFISQVMSGRQKISDNIAESILVKGLKFRPSEARVLVAKWRIEEYSEDLQGIKIDFNTESITMGDLLKVPIVGAVSAGALKESNIIDWDYVTKTGLSEEKEYFVFYVNGVSMSPTIPHGAKVLVERTNEYRPGKIHIFRIGSDYGMGRIIRSDDHYEIQKDNREFLPIPINSPDFEIIGIAVRYSSHL